MAKFKIRLGSYYPTDINIGSMELRATAPSGPRIMGYNWLKNHIHLNGRGFFNYWISSTTQIPYGEDYFTQVREILRNSDK